MCQAKGDTLHTYAILATTWGSLLLGGCDAWSGLFACECNTHCTPTEDTSMDAKMSVGAQGVNVSQGGVLLLLQGAASGTGDPWPEAPGHPGIGGSSRTDRQLSSTSTGTCCWQCRQQWHDIICCCGDTPAQLPGANKPCCNMQVWHKMHSVQLPCSLISGQQYEVAASGHTAFHQNSRPGFIHTLVLCPRLVRKLSSPQPCHPSVLCLSLAAVCLYLGWLQRYSCCVCAV